MSKSSKNGTTRLSLLAALAMGLVLLGFGMVAAVGTYPAVDPNMVLYYHFNNQSAFGENDTHVYDFSGNGNNGTVIGNAIHNNTGGFLGDGAFQFDGVDDTVRAEPTIVSDGYTVSFWLYPKTTTSRVRPTTFRNTWTMFYGDTGDGGTDFSWFPGNGSGISGGATADKYITFEEWQLVTLTYNLTQARLYKNGKLYQILSYSSSLINTSINSLESLCIGSTESSDTCINNWLNGSLDEYIVYNRSLTDRDVWEIYQNYEGCLTIEENLEIWGNATICAGTSYFNDTDTDGVVQIQSGDLTLNMNGHHMISNNTDGSSSPNTNGIIDSSGFSNVIIQNGLIEGYRDAIDTSSSSNWIIENMTIISGRNALVAINVNNFTIRLSNFTNNFNGPYFQGSSNLTFHNNTFYNSTLYLSETNQLENTDIYVYDNEFFSLTQSGDYQIQGRNISRFYIHNNTFLNVTASGFGNIVLVFARDGIIEDNVFDANDRAIHFDKQGRNITVQRNVFNNSFMHIDHYDAPIVMQGNRNIGGAFQNWTSIHILNNTFENFGCNAIVLRDAFEVNISDNVFSQDVVYLTQQSFNCRNEPFTAIFFHQAYKGFIPSGSLADDNYTVASNHTSGDIYVYDNDFGNVNVKLRAQGASNVNHNIDNFWYRSYHNVFSFDREGWWINDDWNNVTLLFNTTLDGLGGYLDTTFISTAANSRPVLNVTIDKRFMGFKNIYTSSSLDTPVNLYNLTSALIYNTNNSIYGNSDISLNDGNINITLPPNNATYILDNFNITRNVTRPHDPLYNATLNRIANNLDATIIVGAHNFTTVSNGTLTSGTVLQRGGNWTIAVRSGDYVHVS